MTKNKHYKGKSLYVVSLLLLLMGLIFCFATLHDMKLACYISVVIMVIYIYFTIMTKYHVSYLFLNVAYTASITTAMISLSSLSWWYEALPYNIFFILVIPCIFFAILFYIKQLRSIDYENLKKNIQRVNLDTCNFTYNFDGKGYKGSFYKVKKKKENVLVKKIITILMNPISYILLFFIQGGYLIPNILSDCGFSKVSSFIFGCYGYLTYFMLVPAIHTTYARAKILYQEEKRLGHRITVV